MTKKDQFSQVLADLETDSSDMMTDPDAFITRVIAKSKELAAQLDAKSTMVEVERTFKEKAMKDSSAKEKAEKIFNEFYDILAEQDSAVQVHFMGLLPELMKLCNSSIRSMSMRTNNVSSLSKRQINLLYIKLKNTYETYIQFMKMFHPDMIPKNPTVIPAKKGNYSDYTASTGIKTYEFWIDGVSYVNPYPVAKMLGIEIVFYMDLPELILEKLVDGKINGHEVVLKDISKDKD